MVPFSKHCSRTRCAWFFVVASPIVLLINLLAVSMWMPDAFTTVVQGTVIIDSQSKFDKTLGKEQAFYETYVYTFYNLTNAHALQHDTPAPKPIFADVRVPVQYKQQARAPPERAARAQLRARMGGARADAARRAQAFDFDLSDDKSKYDVKMWQKFTPVNPADYDKIIINLNPILLGMLGSFPPHMRTIDALADAFANEFTTMQTDGASMMNNGLFVRHTVGEWVMGWSNPVEEASPHHPKPPPPPPVGPLYPFESPPCPARLSLRVWGCRRLWWRSPV